MRFVLLLTVTSRVLLPCGGVEKYAALGLKDIDALSSFVLKLGQWLDTDTFWFPFGLQWLNITLNIREVRLPNLSFCHGGMTAGLCKALLGGGTFLFPTCQVRVVRF